jgi:hypothetical protein
MDWSSGVALAGSLLALLGVFVAGLLAATSQRKHWRFTEQIDACADYLSEYSNVYVAYARAVGTGVAAGAESTAEFVDWVAFNRALNVINLMADRAIVEAAHDLDRALWEVGLRITRDRLPKEQWPDARKPLDEARLRFVNVSRSRLGKGRDPLPVLHGRPPDTDPIWSIRASP